jgi:hypothetical protein
MRTVEEYWHLALRRFLQKIFAAYSPVYRHASAGYDKHIACVLTGKPSEEMVEKVEKPLRKVSL